MRPQVFKNAALCPGWYSQNYGSLFFLVMWEKTLFTVGCKNLQPPLLRTKTKQEDKNDKQDNINQLLVVKHERTEGKDSVSLLRKH